MIIKPNLQIQAVLYNDDMKSLKKTIYAMSNAVRIEREKAGLFGNVKFIYGDASANPLFNDDDIKEINEKIESFMSFEYRFFGMNTGFGKGNNLLAADSDSDYLVIMNPDIIVSPRFLIEMIQPFSGSDTGIVEARQTPVEHHKEYDAETKETGWSSGACFMIPTELFKKLGGFDTDTFFMYCEDVDLSWRVRMEGYKIIYQPLAPVFHAKRLSLKGNWMPSESEVFYSAQSALLMAYKWSNEQLLNKHIYYYRTSGVPSQKKAVEHFCKMKEEGKLPKQLDPEHKVSKFVGNYYTENRFVL